MPRDRHIFWLTSAAGFGLIWLIGQEPSSRPAPSRPMARRRFEVLMFKLPPAEAIQQEPVWHVTYEGLVDFWTTRGWIVLAREREVRYADIEDVREDDERGRR